MRKITPFPWFDSRAEEAATFYMQMKKIDIDGLKRAARQP